MIRACSILPIAALTALSCVDTDRDCGRGATLPAIDAVIESDIKTAFVDGDRIGIYPVTYAGGVAGVLGDVGNPLNVEYIYDGRYWSPAAGEEDLFLDGNTIDIYAYYPYDPGLSRDPGKRDVRAYPFDLSGDQSLKQTDFLWAKSTRVSPDANSALLVFSHVFSRFVINLNYNDSDPADAHLEVHNVWPHVLVDLSDGEVTLQNIRDEIVPMIEATAETGYDLTYVAIVPPQFIGQGTALFSMDNQGDTSVFYLTGDIQFRAGYTYVFNLIIGSIDATPQTRAIAPETIIAIPNDR